MRAVDHVERPPGDRLITMLSPVGMFLVRMDAALAGSMDGIIASVSGAVATPLVLATVIYYGVQGLKLANGDASPLQNFVPQLIRVGVVLWLAINLSDFNYWVRDIFFLGLPNALANAVSGGFGTPATDVSGTAAIFDNLWNQIWMMVGTSWLRAGLSVTGTIAGLSGFLTGVVGGACLAIMAMIYFSARMVLAVIVCIAPVIIACGMFEITRPILERAIGKVVALILLQTIGLIVLQILLLGDQWFMAQVTTAMLSSISNSAAFSQALQYMAGIVVWFMIGTCVMFGLPAIAYSIGSGVALSGSSLMTMALLARSGGGSGSSPADAPFNGGSSPPLSLSVNRPEVSGGNASPSLPPPPPPSISHSTRR